MRTRDRIHDAVVPAGRRAAGALAVVATLLLPLTACTATAEEHNTAQDRVVALLNRTAMSSYTQDIDGFARAADGAAGSGVTLIGIEAAERGDLLGYLTFAVLLDDPVFTQNAGGFFQDSADDWDPGPYCFEVAFDAYGSAGEYGTAQGIDTVQCPDDTSAVTPPPSTEPVVAPEAREAAHAVLEALGTAGGLDPDAIAAQIDALLPTELDGRPIDGAAVAVEGTDVGVAMGGPDDCVLVARSGGAVTDVYPPSVYLQPGELGCTPWTALTDDLRPPH